MKNKKSALWLCFVCLFAFASCSAAPAASSSIAAEAGSFVQPQQASHLGPLVSKVVYWGDGNEDGYYEIVNFPNRTNLTYIDYATQQQVVLCSRPECLHQDETCAAYITCAENAPRPCTWKDKLLLVYGGSPAFYSEFGEAALPRIEMVNASGGDKKVVHTFAPNEDVDNSFAVDDQYMYVIKYITQEPETDEELMFGKSEKVVERIDLNTGEAAVLYSIPASLGAMALRGCYGDQLIFVLTETGTPGLMGTPEDDSVNTLFGISRVDGGRTDYLSWKRGEMFGVVFENRFIFLKSDQSINALDFDTGEQTRLVDAFDGTVEESTFDLYIDGCLYVEVDRNVMDATGTTIGFEMKRYKVDLETGETKELTLMADWREVTRPVQILAETEQDLLVISHIEAHSVDEVGDDGVLYSQMAEQQEYALISKSDFDQSIPNYRVIDKLF